MNAAALTPFFQWMARPVDRPVAPDVSSYPAPVSGNHAGEAVFLAVATALLTATALTSLTAGISAAWLRWPVGLILLFLVPHVVMALVSLMGGMITGTWWHRGAVQDWGCLTAMTAYAAWRSPATGWTGWICQGWLVFMAVNGLIGLYRLVSSGRNS